MARTVALSTITQALIDEQNSSSRVPHIRIYINSVDYTARLLYLEHHEEAYRDRAVIGLSNRDSSLDGLDLDGKEFEIAYGYVTGNAVAEPLGNNGTAEYVYTATLWVKSHQIISIQGERIYQIYAEGLWMRLREQKVIAGVTGPQGDLYSNTFNRTHTVYELIELIVEGALGWTLEGTPPNDGLMNVFRPVFDVNEMPFENAAALLYRLLWMTKEYLRPKKTKTFQCVYPQTTDAADETYYSNKAHWFYEYVEKSILLIPNSIVVLCNQDPDSNQWNTAAFPIIVGVASDSAQITKYAEILEVFIAGSINNLTDANNRAAAILTKLKSEILGGRLVIPHDARVELYDKVEIQDWRGT